MTLPLPAPSISDFTGIQQNFDAIAQQFPINARNLTSLEGWHIVGTSGEPGFQNGWANYSFPAFNNAGFYKDPFGRVCLRGMVATGTIGTAIFTLPAGYRPPQTELQVTISNAAIGRVDITPAGAVMSTTGSNIWFSLDGVTFRAG
jgi:hypothetical protein